MFNDQSASTLAVFSHPNHELAILGLLQRLRPNIIVLTDGGGGTRLTESQKGLESIDLLDQATFLNFPEASFYDSLCARDHSFFKEVAERVFNLMDYCRPTQILCDAVEFYNPVHDLSLPIVRSAVRKSRNVAVFEVPLIYQKSKVTEDYEVQRFPTSRREEQIEIKLTDVELKKKLGARDRVYVTLMDELGPVLSHLPPDHVALEVVAPACSAIPTPCIDQTLRYEWRGEVLLKKGMIHEVITYQGHYLPIASTLLS